MFFSRLSYLQTFQVFFWGGYSAAMQRQYTSTIHNFQLGFLHELKDRDVLYKLYRKNYKKEKTNMLINQPVLTEIELHLPLLGSLFCAGLFFLNTIILLSQTNILLLTKIEFCIHIYIAMPPIETFARLPTVPLHRSPNHFRSLLHQNICHIYKLSSDLFFHILLFLTQHGIQRFMKYTTTISLCSLLHQNKYDKPLTSSDIFLQIPSLQLLPMKYICNTSGIWNLFS